MRPGRADGFGHSELHGGDQVSAAAETVGEAVHAIEVAPKLDEERRSVRIGLNSPTRTTPHYFRGGATVRRSVSVFPPNVATIVCFPADWK